MPIHDSLRKRIKSHKISQSLRSLLTDHLGCLWEDCKRVIFQTGGPAWEKTTGKRRWRMTLWKERQGKVSWRKWSESLHIMSSSATSEIEGRVKEPQQMPLVYLSEATCLTMEMVRWWGRQGLRASVLQLPEKEFCHPSVSLELQMRLSPGCITKSNQVPNG